MIGRPFRVDWHPEDTPEALRAAYRAQQDTMLRTRLHALWLLRCGLHGRCLIWTNLKQLRGLGGGRISCHTNSL